MSRPDHYDPNLPSVTELLKWSGYYDSYPNDPSGYYLRRGTWVDRCCSILAQGQLLDDRTIEFGLVQREKPLVGAAECWGGYVDAFHAWLTREETMFVADQGYVINQAEGYQGTYDLVVLRPKRVLVDIKTGSCLKATALQTAGYALCLGMPYPRRLGLELHADGAFTEYEYRDHKDFDAFRLMVRWYHRRSDYR